ncbi:MAG: stage III sporulation protein AG [Lachnospira sp.]|nr:stage III sporulation protein AG [Lachnospira sp.]
MNKLIENFLNKSGKEKITIVILIGVLLLVIFIPTGGNKDKAGDSSGSVASDVQQSYSTSLDYETYIENKLEETLRKVEGVGTVEAVVTIRSSEENVLAKDSEQDVSVSDETDATGGTRHQKNDSTKDTYIYYDSADGSQPYIVLKNMPKVEGVVIVAKGGGDGNVAAAITSAVEALLDIPAHKIKVLKMS